LLVNLFCIRVISLLEIERIDEGSLEELYAEGAVILEPVEDKLDVR
jgi:hypothetical protein